MVSPQYIWINAWAIMQNAWFIIAETECGTLFHKTHQEASWGHGRNTLVCVIIGLLILFRSNTMLNGTLKVPGKWSVKLLSLLDIYWLIILRNMRGTGKPEKIWFPFNFNTTMADTCTMAFYAHTNCHVLSIISISI